MQNNNKKIIFAFWFIVIFSIQAIFSFLYKNNLKLNVGGFSYPLENIAVNVAMKKPVNQNLFICFDDYCETLESDLFHKTFYIKYNDEHSEFLNSKVKNIYLENSLNKYIDNIFVCVGNKSYYFGDEDIKKFDVKTSKLEVSDKKSDINLMKLPVKSNYKGIYNNISNSFLSLFYNWSCCLYVAYFWLFIAFLLWVFNRELFNFKIKAIYPLVLFILIGALLRANFLGYNPLWIDEIYTKEVAIKNFISCFHDPGNPPLFFILEFLITKIIGKSAIALRILPYLISVLTIPLVYLFFRDYNKNLVLFSSFFVSINLIAICHGADARSYSLSMFLGILSIYTLFNYLNSPDNKNLIKYALCALCAINTHYYLAIFTFTNFIWGIVDLISNKNKIFKFVIANFIAGLSFIPYFLVVKQSAFVNSFNAWIGQFNINSFKYLIDEFFINKYVFIFLCLIVLINLVILYLPEKFRDKLNIKIDIKKENLFIYLIYSLAFIVIIISAISLYIKPIFNRRIFLSIYFLLLLLEIVSISRLFCIEKSSKILKTLGYFYSLFLILICFLITKPMPFENIYRIDEFINFLNYDSIRFKDEYEINTLVNIDDNYLKNFPEISDKKYIKWHFIDTNSAKFLKNIKKSKYTNAKKAIIYSNNMTADGFSITQFNPNSNFYKTNSNGLFRIFYEE